MYYHNKNRNIIFPPYPKLYPNGNTNRDFSNEESTINYKKYFKPKPYHLFVVKKDYKI